MLKIDNLTIAFPNTTASRNRTPARPVLQRLDLELEAGELLVLLGSSGSGKSTMLGAIAGLVEPTSGEIWLEGDRIDTLPPHLRGVAFVMQNGGWYDHLTVREHFQLHRRKVDAREIDSVIERVGLSVLQDRLPSQLSGGQLQRLSIGRALLRKAALILLDEPLNQLDRASRDSLRQLIQDIHRETARMIIYVTHESNDAYQLATKVAVLDHGTLRQIDIASEIDNNPAHLSVALALGEPLIQTFTHDEGLQMFPGIRSELQQSLGDGECVFAIRPCSWKLDRSAEAHFRIEGKVSDYRYWNGHWLGSFIPQSDRRCEKKVEFLAPSTRPTESLWIAAENLFLFDKSNGNRIRYDCSRVVDWDKMDTRP